GSASRAVTCWPAALMAAGAPVPASSVLESIPQPPYRVYEARARGAVAELAPDVGHVHLDRTVVRLRDPVSVTVVVGPEQGRQIAFGHGPAVCTLESSEDIKLGAGELDQLAAQANRAACGVDFEAPDGRTRRGGPFRSRRCEAAGTA